MQAFMTHPLISTALFGSLCVLSACSQSSGISSKIDEVYSGTFAILDNLVRDDLLRCGVNQDEFNRLLSLPENKFDQDFEGGWRATTYKEACNNAAAEMIKAYILYSEPKPAKNQNILRWHAGQTKAAAGNYDEAISLFKGTYEPDQDRGIAWNLYVDATLAFLQNDREALTLTHDTLAKLTVSEEEKANRRKFLKDNPNITMSEGFVDNPNNLAPVKSLLRCFGQPYSVAYGRYEK